MSSYSDFQLKHPLSQKKYLKKMLSISIVSLFFSIFVGGAIEALRFMVADGASYDFFLATLISLLIFGIIWSLYSWYVSAYIRLYYYNCDENFITIKKGVFMPVEIHVLYQKIQDVYVDQDIIDRLLGIYDVHIASATASSAIEAHIDGLDKETAEAAKDFLLAKVHGHSTGTNSKANISSKSSKSMAAIKYDKSESVSSKNYPIATRWLLAPFLSAFFYSAILAFLFLSDEDGKGVSYNFIILGSIVIGIGKFIWSCIWKKNYYFELTEENILLKTGVISRSSRHLPYKSIQDISVSQSVVDRLLGLYSVSIQDATSSAAGLVIVGQSKEQADKLSSILNGIIGKKSDPSSMGL